MIIYSRVEALQGYSSSNLQVDFNSNGIAEVEEEVANYLCNLQPLIYSVNKEDLHPSYRKVIEIREAVINDDIET